MKLNDWLDISYYGHLHSSMVEVFYVELSNVFTSNIQALMKHVCIYSYKGFQAVNKISLSLILQYPHPFKSGLSFPYLSKKPPLCQSSTDWKITSLVNNDVLLKIVCRCCVIIMMFSSVFLPQFVQRHWQICIFETFYRYIDEVYSLSL